jgi:hypothetical protein
MYPQRRADHLFISADENETIPIFVHLLLAIVLLIGASGPLSAQKKSAVPADSGGNVVRDVQEYSKGTGFFSRLVRMALVQDELARSGPLDRDKKIFAQASGKIIREISIDVLDVFGASIDHPTEMNRSWLEGTGNSVHAKTKRFLIKNMLIFTEGDKFTPYAAKESERIIRQSPYVYDVRIVPQKLRSTADSVDVIVYVQDLWSITGKAAYHRSENDGKFEIGDINFFGYGNELRAGVDFDHTLADGWDWNASYTVNNIARTFLSSRLFYASDVTHEQYGFSVGRDFFSPIITWAGGIGQYWVKTRYPELLTASGVVENDRYNQQDYWLGYAFDVNAIDSTREDKNRFNVSGRVTRTVYSERPAQDSVDLFQNNTFYLGRIGYSRRTYFQDHYLLGLGVTEDIPLVTMIALLGGYEVGSTSSRPYYGISTSYGMHDDSLGYFFGGFQIGAFRNSGTWLDANILLEFMHISDLHALGDWHWRQYMGARYAYSVDPLRPQGVLTINNDGGLRGFSDNYLTGTKKVIANYEADFFTPLTFLGFKLAVITFADLGLISSEDRSLAASKLYQGYGFGFRIRNEHLVFPSFQFMIGYYPNLNQADGVHFGLFHQSTTAYRFNKFQYSAPAIVVAE